MIDVTAINPDSNVYVTLKALGKEQQLSWIRIIGNKKASFFRNILIYNKLKTRVSMKLLLGKTSE